MTSKEAYRRYNQSDKGQARRLRYKQSPKGIMSKFRASDKYRLTEKGRLAQERFYAKHGGKSAYEMERYYRIQDEAGRHCGIDNFYPAYRLIKALETAEIVEIKDPIRIKRGK